MKDLYLIGSLPGWLVALIAVVTVALLVQQFFALTRRLPVGQSVSLTALRALVYGVLIFFLFGPALIDKRVTKLRRPLTVLIDSSQSMGFPASAKSAPGDKNAKSRLDLVREKLAAGAQEPMLQKLNRDYDLKLVRLGTGLEPISTAGLAGLTPQDPGTRLLELLQATARAGSAASAGVIVFTDGITNGDKKTLDGGPTLTVPVFAVGVGEAEGFTDVRIAKLGAPEFAFAAASSRSI
jgi:hypothetical protein